jgi:hypothetical protein
VLNQRALKSGFTTKMRAALAVGIVCGIACGGCRSDQQNASSTATRFITALEHKDANEIKSLLTQEGQAKWTGDLTKDSEKSDKKDDVITIKQIIVKDQIATALASVQSGNDKPNDIDIDMKRENGEWKVNAMSFPGNGMTIKYDFEHPEAFLGDVMRGVGQALGEGFKQVGKGLQSLAEGFANGMKDSSAGSKSSK